MIKFELPEQKEDPDWTKVSDYALQAAAFTLNGDMAKANDVYQHMAIEVMNTLYGPNAVATFIKLAMLQPVAPEQPRIVLS
jgi:hypothetical protein